MRKAGGFHSKILARVGRTGSRGTEGLTKLIFVCTSFLSEPFHRSCTVQLKLLRCFFVIVERWNNSKTVDDICYVNKS